MGSQTLNLHCFKVRGIVKNLRPPAIPIRREESGQKPNNLLRFQLRRKWENTDKKPKGVTTQMKALDECSPVMPLPVLSLKKNAVENATVFYCFVAKKMEERRQGT